MKKVIISLLTIMVTGCSTLLDELEKPLKPKINENNYWKTPCFLDGTTLKKPWKDKSKPLTN